MTAVRINDAQHIYAPVVKLAKANNIFCELGAIESSYETIEETRQMIYDAENNDQLSHACADRALYYLDQVICAD